MAGKRAQRRLRGRAKEESALRARYPEHLFVKGPHRLKLTGPKELQGILEFLKQFDASTDDCRQPVLLDLHATSGIDAAGCVLLAATLQRCRIRKALRVDVRLPRNGSARFALKVFGVADDAEAGDAVPVEIERKIMKVNSGMKGDPSPGARTFEVAQLIEGLVTDETLADRVHAALNEAADNVLSWAYGAEATPDPAERWWVAGMLNESRATFIALDHGLSIPTTAPQNFGDALQGFVKSMIQDKEWRQLNIKPTDDQVLMATIRQRRTVSGLEERGKGLTNMIALIDHFAEGFINIFSGDALYGYRNSAVKEDEHCSPLGFVFPGTLIIWQLKARAAEAQT